MKKTDAYKLRVLTALKSRNYTLPALHKMLTRSTPKGQGTIYGYLADLETDGLVKKIEGKKTAGRSGPSAKLYQITPKGLKKVA